MSDVTGIKRLRQAIDNQSAAGEACFSLPAGESRAICDECEDELARVSWAHGVPAPVDADGEVVPLTTEVMYDEGGREFECTGFKYSDLTGCKRTWWVRASIIFIEVQKLHLRCPDSWERLEGDVESMLRNGTCAYFGRSGRESCEGCQAFAIDNLSCSHGIVRDVLRRAKALAGRDAKWSTPQPSPHEAKGAGRD